MQTTKLRSLYYGIRMTENYSAKLGITLNSIYLICIMLFTVGITYNHIQLISHEYPLDYNEGGMLVITSTIAHGESPYSLQSQPTRISVYPILYNILVAPLSRVFGLTLELHRAVAGLFILACCAICFYLCRKESVARTESFTAAALLYAGLLHYSTPIAGPNSLGLFLFLSAITIPWVYGFSKRSLCAAIILGILAFYTKQYFIACLGYVAFYLFIAESKKRAVSFGLAALATFIALMVFVSYISPYYFDNTFFAVKSGAKLTSSDTHLVTQLRGYTLIYLPLFVVLTAWLVKKCYLRIFSSAPYGQNVQKEKFVKFFDFDAPLLLRRPNYIWFCCACSTLIIVLSLGKNVGNYLTYFFQLISPFLLVGIFALISGMPKWRWPIKILIVFALYNNYAMLPTDFSVSEKSWQIIKQEIEQADDLYASTLVLQEIMKKESPVYLNGHTRYFPFGQDKPASFVKSDEKNRVPEIWERYIELIQTKIKNQAFDVLLIDQYMAFPSSSQNSVTDTKTLLEANYKKTANVRLPLAKRRGGGGFNVQVWKPILATSDESK
jgi:hypothetical protein